jgi:t-SNARE complex subunit (syntaxin)
MKSIFILAAAIAVFGLTFYMQEKTVAPLLQNSGLSQLFNEWKELHGRQYDTLEEELYRLSLFTERHFFIQNYNSKTVKLGHNQFSDLSNHEFRALHVNKKLSIAPKKEEAHVLPIVNVP